MLMAANTVLLAATLAETLLRRGHQGPHQGTKHVKKDTSQSKPAFHPAVFAADVG
jgi:hypothetical protein